MCRSSINWYTSFMEMNMEEIQGLTVDGFDEAIIGHEPNADRFVYDRQKMIDVLVTQDEMSTEEAIEYLEYNVWGAYVGEHTPIYINVGTLSETTV